MGNEQLTVDSRAPDRYIVSCKSYFANINVPENYMDYMPKNGEGFGQTLTIKLTGDGLMRFVVNPTKWVKATQQDIEALAPVKRMAASLNRAVNNHEDLKAALEEIVKSVNCLENPPK